MDELKYGYLFDKLFRTKENHTMPQEDDMKPPRFPSDILQEISEDINQLEELKAVDLLKVLLGYLKMTIKGIDPDYDITRDPTG